MGAPDSHLPVQGRVAFVACPCGEIFWRSFPEISWEYVPPALPKVSQAPYTINSVLLSFNNSDNFSFSDTNMPSHHNPFPSPYSHPGHPMCSVPLLLLCLEPFHFPPLFTLLQKHRQKISILL